jgi:hypothetical protein
MFSSQMIFWFAQAVGLVALGFSVLAYQSKSKQQLLDRQMAGSFVYVLHYSLLGGWTGVAMNGIVAVRNWVFGKKGSASWADNPAWMWAFMAIAVAFLPFTWDGYISILPVIAMILGVYSRWQEHVSHIRLFTLIGCALWIPYNFVVASYTGIIVDVIVIGSVLYGMWKHDRIALKEEVTAV